jgi:hypothetical protein
MKRYLVIALRLPTFQSAAIEPHRAFLAQLRQQGVLELAGAITSVALDD